MTNTKKILDRLLRRVVKLSVVGGLVVGAGLVGLAEVNYRNGLTFLPKNSAPSSGDYGEKLLHAQWISLGGQGEIPRGSMFPGHMVRRIAYHVMHREVPEPAAPSDRLTMQAARLLLSRRRARLSRGEWRLAMVSAAGWIDQNWSAGQRLETVLSESRSGLGCQGIEGMARRLLGKKLDSLTIEEAALLVSVQTLPFSYLKRRNRVLLRVNRVIAGLVHNYPGLYSKAYRYSALPFGMLELERARRECRG